MSSYADTKFQKDHPRREQVNSRLENQNDRINKEVKEGDMSKAKAAKLHKADKQIRQEERDMAAQNGGHITKQEQKTLNQQENMNSKKIGKWCASRRTLHKIDRNFNFISSAIEWTIYFSIVYVQRYANAVREKSEIPCQLGWFIGDHQVNFLKFLERNLTGKIPERSNKSLKNEIWLNERSVNF